MPFKKGNKEGSKVKSGGQKVNWFKSWSHELLSKDSTLKRIERIFEKGDDKMFWEVAKYFHELNHGKPVQQIDASFKVNIGQLLGELPDHKRDAIDTTAEVQTLENGQGEEISTTLDSQDHPQKEIISRENRDKPVKVGSEKKQNKAHLEETNPE